MEIAEVQDADSLARFLTTTHPALARQLSHRLAARAAARVMPYAVHFLLSSPRPKKHGYTPMEGWLALLMGVVESAHPDPVVYGGDPAGLRMKLSAQMEYLDALTNAAHAFDRAAATSNGLYAVAIVMDRERGVEGMGAACAVCADALHELEENAYANDLAWGAVRADLTWAVGKDWGLDAPLWLSGEVPGSVAKAWASAKVLMLEDKSAHWAFWVAWYERLLDGRDVLTSQMPGLLVGVIGRPAYLAAEVNPMFDEILADFRQMEGRDARDVRDKESLEVYLRRLPEDEVQRVARRVAFRAAARVLPFAMQAYGPRVEDSLKNLWTVPVLGALVVASVEDAAPGVVSNGAAYATSLAAARAAEETIGGASVAALRGMPNDGDPDDINKVATFARMTSSSVTAVSAAVTAVVSKDAVPAAVAAVAAACEAVDLWGEVRHDLQNKSAQVLWRQDAPGSLMAAFDRLETAMAANDEVDWSFWWTWYLRILSFEELHPKALAQVLNTFLEKEDWERGPAHINPLFDDVLALYRGEDVEEAAPTELADAAPVEFSFDTLARVMRMVGITDNLGHLKEPGIVQAFVDDAEEVRDLFQDFADYASELAPGGNYAGILKRAAEKVLGEFARTEDQMHLRANRLVILASELEVFSKDARARSDLGETLSGMLDTRIELLKTLCRQHFGPSYLALAPLAQLKLDQVDQEQVIAIFDHAIGFVEGLPSPDMVALDVEGVAVLRDMLQELRTYRAAIAEASTEAFQGLLEDRFAQSSGALGLTLTRFFERSVTATGQVGKAADVVIKQNKRVTSLLDIVEVVASGFGG